MRRVLRPGRDGGFGLINAGTRVRHKYRNPGFAESLDYRHDIRRFRTDRHCAHAVPAGGKQFGQQTEVTRHCMCAGTGQREKWAFEVKTRQRRFFQRTGERIEFGKFVPSQRGVQCRQHGCRAIPGERRRTGL